MFFSLCGCPFYAAERVLMVVLFEEQQSLEMFCWLPHVVTFGIP